jgi:hypothetical protein
MTYNFDSQRWYEIQTTLLRHRFERGELDEPAYRAALSDLDRRLEEMERRLDRSFQVSEDDHRS